MNQSDPVGALAGSGPAVLPMKSVHSLAPRLDKIVTHPTAQPPESSLYSDRFETGGEGAGEWAIVGVNLRLQDGDPASAYGALHVPDGRTRGADASWKPATRKLVIACDTLSILSPLRLPECDVVIYARILEFGENGRLDTSPLPFDLPKAPNAELTSGTQGKDGASGPTAGPVTIYASKVVCRGEAAGRIIARGGDGQAGGDGRDGMPGQDMDSWTSIKRHHEDSGLGTTWCTEHFDPPAVYIKGRWQSDAFLSWFVNAIADLASFSYGSDRWPGDGTHALAPGKPGEPGNGGTLRTNHRDIPHLLTNPGGRAGAASRAVTGGRRGSPWTSAKYEVTFYWDGSSDNGRTERKKTGKRETKEGNSYPAQWATRQVGDVPAPVFDGPEHAWVHPLALQRLLIYARDAYLGGRLAETEALLAEYETVLLREPPTQLARPSWTPAGRAQWDAAAVEVATMLHRLRSRLDYFGNPAGHVPIFSLQGAMRLYRMNSDTAARTIVMARWYANRGRKADTAAAAAADALTLIAQSSRELASQVESAEVRADDFSERIVGIIQQQKDIAAKMEAIEARLRPQAQEDLQRKALIEFGVRTAAAICQVIPYGQPVLGTAANSLTSIILDMPSDASAAFQQASAATKEIGDSFDQAARSSAEAANKLKEATKGEAEQAKAEGEPRPAVGARAGDRSGAPPRAVDPAKEAAAQADTLKQIAGVAGGLASGLSQMSKAVAALRVPESEVEAAMAKLADADPEFQALTSDLRTLVQAKAAFYNDLTRALQTVGEGYSRLATNANAAVSIDRRRTSTLATVDHEARTFVAQLDQRAKFALVQATYSLVKSYETTVFKPLTTPWELTHVVDKLLAEHANEDDLAMAHREAVVSEVRGILEGVITDVRNRLVEEYAGKPVRSSRFDLTFSPERTPRLLQQLNRVHQVTIDPHSHGLVLPGEQREFIADVSLDEIEFDDADGLDEGTAYVTLQTGQQGIVRVGDRLFGVQQTAPWRWGWTYSFHKRGKPEASTQSAGMKDIQNEILGNDPAAAAMSQKLASPALWSTLALRVEFVGIRPKPTIRRMRLTVQIDSLPAEPDERVLDVRTNNALAEIGCAVGTQAPGPGRIGRPLYYEICRVGTPVELTVREHDGHMRFERWQVEDDTGARTYYTEPKLSLTMRRHTRVQCWFTSGARV